MRVSTNTVSNSILRQLTKLGEQQTLFNTQVATGQRIFNPSDDPAAAGRVISNQTEQRKISQYLTNIGKALELSQATYGGLEKIKAVSDRAGELATLGAGAISTDAMAAYAAEVDELIEEAVTLGNSRFGGDYLFAGTAVDTAPFTWNAAGDAIEYNGNTSQLGIPVSDGSAIKPGSAGATNESIADFINQLVGLRDALLSGDTTAVNDLRAGLEATEDVFVTALSGQGAVQMRLEVTQTQHESRMDNLEQVISNDADVDLTTAYVKLSRVSTAYEAALASSSNIMRMSLLDFL
ncbi:flagellar hook-associated protein FlgL [Termitidicoccus mucosus]|uniref:Flagellin n=1 Tax=Termitidicoccus mucosus TaxID=1184151 RepID=A0A178IFZ7_9BACT|nr:flagellin [Opitutaceae bacterium TSB47]